MTPRQVRADLRGPLLAAGLHAVGARFVHETPELVHSLDVTAVRRLAGHVQIHHEIALKPDRRVVLTQEIVSHGFQSDFPRIWAAESVDPQLVTDQVSAICRSFGAARDVAHFFSDRSHLNLDIGATQESPAAPVHTLCASQAQQVLQRMAREILAPEFSLVPQHEPFEVWCSRLEMEGYRHCTYLQANETCTLAHLEMFSLPAATIENHFRSDDALRQLMTAPKSALRAHGRPVLIPMVPIQAVDHGPLRQALLLHMVENPPHRLPR